MSTIISKAYELGKPSKVNYDYATDVNSTKLLEFGEGMKFGAVFEVGFIAGLAILFYLEEI